MIYSRIRPFLLEGVKGVVLGIRGQMLEEYKPQVPPSRLQPKLQIQILADPFKDGPEQRSNALSGSSND